MEVCLFKGRGGDNISRKILSRISKFISQQLLDYINLNETPTKIKWEIHAFFTLMPSFEVTPFLKYFIR